MPNVPRPTRHRRRRQDPYPAPMVDNVEPIHGGADADGQFCLLIRTTPAATPPSENHERQRIEEQPEVADVTPTQNMSAKVTPTSALTQSVPGMSKSRLCSAPAQSATVMPNDARPTAPEKYSFDCPICTQKCHEPFTTRCGHLFCRECITRCVRKTKKCPICQKPHSLRTIHRIYT